MLFICCVLPINCLSWRLCSTYVPHSCPSLHLKHNMLWLGRKLVSFWAESLDSLSGIFFFFFLLACFWIEAQKILPQQVGTCAPSSFECWKVAASDPNLFLEYIPDSPDYTVLLPLSLAINAGKPNTGLQPSFTCKLQPAIHTRYTEKTTSRPRQDLQLNGN